MIPLNLQYRSTTRASSTTSISSDYSSPYIKAQKDLEMRRKANDLSWTVRSLGERINKASLKILSQNRCFSKQMRGLEDEFCTANESLKETRKLIEESVSQISQNKQDLQATSISKEKVKVSQEQLCESSSSLSLLVKCLPILIQNIQQTKEEYQNSIKKNYKLCEEHRELQAVLLKKNIHLKSKQEYRDSLRNAFKDKQVQLCVLAVDFKHSKKNVEALSTQIKELSKNIESKAYELDEEIKKTDSNISVLDLKVKLAENKLKTIIK